MHNTSPIRFLLVSPLVLAMAAVIMTKASVIGERDIVPSTGVTIADRPAEDDVKVRPTATPASGHAAAKSRPSNAPLTAIRHGVLRPSTVSTDLPRPYADRRGSTRTLSVAQPDAPVLRGRPTSKSGGARTVESCLGDLTDSGAVGLQDLLILINNWGPCPGSVPGCTGDLTDSGAVGLQDLLILINSWGPCPTGACCLDQGDCQELNAVDCDGAAGAFFGEQSLCSEVQCEEPICPDGALDENEPCGNNANNGCNVQPHSFGPSLTCGDTVCGTVWAQGGQRDTDWFNIELTQPTQVTLSVDAEFPAQVFIVNHLCGSDLYVHATATGDGSGEVSASACLPPGEYRLIVTVDATEGLPCGGSNEYAASVSCEPCTPAGQSCANAISVPTNSTAVHTSTTGRDVPELDDCIGFGEGDPTSPTVWFSVEGTGTQLTVTTCGPHNLETNLSVFCGVCDNLACVAGTAQNDFSCGPNPLSSTVTFCSHPGQTYYIAVWESFAGTAGPVTLTASAGGSSCTPDVICPSAGICDGFCGGQSADGCWCDDFVCEMFGDCCPGICIDCPDLQVCESGSCAGVPCGQQSPDGCWCDETCGGFDDCCNDVCDECPLLSHCLGCDPVVCTDNENEPCGDAINNGCASVPQLFSPINCGDTICGNLWADNNNRDIDYFELTLTEASVVTWSVEAEHEVNVLITNGLCGANQEILAIEVGCSASVDLCLTPGTYHLVISPTAFEGAPCPGITYLATVTCQADPECVAGSCAGACGAGSPPGCVDPNCDCWCDEECDFFGDCCDDACDECPALSHCN